jgi:hypothetical protein
LIVVERPEICLVEANRGSAMFVARYLNNFFYMVLLFKNSRTKPEVKGHTFPPLIALGPRNSLRAVQLAAGKVLFIGDSN